MQKHIRLLSLLAIAFIVLASCIPVTGPSAAEDPKRRATNTPRRAAPAVTATSVRATLTTAPTLTQTTGVLPTGTRNSPPAATSQSVANSDLTIHINPNQNKHPISPLIYGVSVAPNDVLQDLRPTFNSWGGNSNTRYNWQIGNAWNAGRDWQYRNGNGGNPEGNVADRFINESAAVGAEVRLAVPTIGWVAKDTNNNTCSFPLPGGGCGDGNGSDCYNQAVIADPNTANVRSTPDTIRAWMQHIFTEQNLDVRFVAMDNEPEIWGYTHYDVHPSCVTYDEILQQYVTYAAVVREVAPQAELVGPTTCCWWFYWNTAPGDSDKQAHGGQDFLPWFLDQMRQRDEDTGVKLIDVLDIHYYPEGDIYNANVDASTAARRLRSTRTLWDPTYVAESWINTPIYLIPRMKQLIADHYPGLKLGISEWNFGAEGDINGALAVADVLGIFGREDLYYASYWTHPPVNTPSYQAFKMYTSYDDQGSRFGGQDGGISIQAASDDESTVSSFAALNQSGDRLYLMLVNKNPTIPVLTGLDLQGLTINSQATMYRYSSANLQNIVSQPVTLDPNAPQVELPANSITMLIMERQSITYSIWTFLASIFNQ